MTQTNFLNDILKKIADHVEERAHYSSFNKESSGPALNINDPAALTKHITDTINDPETKRFAASADGRKMYFYNEKTNTVVIIDPDSPSGGSAYRPKNASQGARWFEKQRDEAERVLGRKPEVPTGGVDMVEGRLSGGQPGHAPHTPSPAHPAGEHSGSTHTPHAPHAGRVAGVIGVVLGAAAAAGEAAAAEGRKPNAGDYVAGAWNNTVGGALTQGRKMEAVMRIADCLDPSMGMISGGLRNAARAAGANVDPSIVESVEKLKPEDRRRFQRNCNLLAVNARDQLAILQEGGLADICDTNGKRVDIGAILRDPTQRQAFMDKLQSSYETTQDPAEKEKLRRMISASNRYSELQDYRQQIIADTTAILQNPNSGARPTPLPQSPMAPLASVGTKSFNLDMTTVSEQMTKATIDKLLDPNSSLPVKQTADLSEFRKEDLLNPATFLMRTKSETELPAKGSIKEAPKSLPALDTIPF